MDKPGLEALLTSLDHWAGLFILLVVIGVGGELVVHLLSSRASGRLIALQNAEEQKLKTELSRLGGVTAEANKVAAQANERANEMEVQAEELRRQNLEIQRKANTPAPKAAGPLPIPRAWPPSISATHNLGTAMRTS